MKTGGNPTGDPAVPIRRGFAIVSGRVRLPGPHPSWIIGPRQGRVAEWQTRTVQVRVSGRTWEFNSPHAHHKEDRVASSAEATRSVMRYRPPRRPDTSRQVRTNHSPSRTRSRSVARPRNRRVYAAVRSTDTIRSSEVRGGTGECAATLREASGRAGRGRLCEGVQGCRAPRRDPQRHAAGGGGAQGDPGRRSDPGPEPVC